MPLLLAPLSKAASDPAVLETSLSHVRGPVRATDQAALPH